MQTKALTKLALILTFIVGIAYSQPAAAQFPGIVPGSPMVAQTSYMEPSVYGGTVRPAMYHPSMGTPGAVVPVGYCDGYDMGCCGSGGCGAGACGCGNPGGLIGNMCGGDRLSLCETLAAYGQATGLSGLGSLCTPYTEAGSCAQRWFDIQAEVMFLSMEGSATDQVLSSRGQGVVNAVTGAVITNPVLSTSNADFGGVSPGWRLTGSLLFGAGGNLEATYFGSHHFSSAASTTATTVGGVSQFDLFSAFSAFGTNPGGAPNVAGFDDTDRSSVHSVQASSDIHSGELNYRRRWVGPFCRFQGSWLVGFRYFDVDEQLGFDARGAINDTAAATDPRFFTSITQTRNALVGAQLGGDFWWNVTPGINLGIGWKGAIFGNTAEQDTVIRSNSVDLIPGVSQVLEQAQGSNTALMSELQARLVYRFSYSWSFTAAYWMLGLDGLALGAGNLNTSQADRLFANPLQARNVSINIDDSITLHGFSLGLEYLW